MPTSARRILALVSAWAVAVGVLASPVAAVTANAAPSPAQVNLLGTAMDSTELAPTIAMAMSEAFDDVLWDACDAAARLNNFGFTYDEADFCISPTSAVWTPDLSISALCSTIVAPAGAVIVDVAASKTSVWSVDNSGTARGCVLPALGASDIKSMVTRYRTAMTQYRISSLSDVLKALDTCEQSAGTNPCQVYNAVTKVWSPDPKKLPTLALPPMPTAIVGTAVSVTAVSSIAAGDTFQVFTKTDGTVAARCDSTLPSEVAGQCMAPAAANGSMRVAAAGRHAVALRADGTVTEWGSITVNSTVTAAKAPAGLSSVVDVAAGRDFALALLADGSVTAWGDNSSGQTAVPTGVAGASNIVQIAAGDCHAVALRADGKVVTWGCSAAGQGLAAGKSAAAIAAYGARTVLWSTNGSRQVFGTGSAATDITSPVGAVQGFDAAAGRYYAGGGTCIVDKTEDVIRDELSATSTRAEAPLSLSSATTPGESADWVYTWSAPQRAGASPVTGYIGRWDNRKGRYFSDWAPVTSPFRAPKAPPGWLTRFEVRAVTAAGTGAIAHIATSEIRICGQDQASDLAIALMSSSVSAPAAPTVSATALSATQVAVRWNGGDLAGGAGRPSYTVRISTDGTSWTSTAARGYFASLAGLRSGTDYRVQVVATNSVGSATSATVTVRTLSDAFATALATTAVSGRSVALAWKAPTAVLAKDIKDYRVEWSADGTSWTVFPHAASTKTAITVTGLRAATSYQFRVTVITTAGDGAPTASLPVTTTTDAPGAPGPVSVTAIAATNFDVAWSEPSDTGGLPITGYSVTLKPSTGLTVTINGTTARVTGAKGGTTYAVTVAAKNIKGTGTGSATSVLVAVPPATPTATVLRTATAVTITWKAPATGGSKILGYRTAVTPATLKYTVTGTKAVFTGLANGTTLTFSVLAYNIKGDGQPLVVSTGTAVVPGAVTALTYTHKDTRSTTLTWAAPTTDGGSKLTGYKLRSSSDGGKTWTDWSTAKSPATVPRPAAGASVRVEIAAANAVGIGTASGITIVG